MDFSKLSLGDKIVGGTSIVLLIDLLFLPWHSATISYGVLGSSFSHTYTAGATGSPNGFLGILALLLTIAIVGTAVVRKLTTSKLPDLPIAWGLATFYGAIAVAALLLLKLILKTQYLGYGSYLAIVLAGGLTYGAFLGKGETDEGGASTGGTGDSGSATPF